MERKFHLLLFNRRSTDSLSLQKTWSLDWTVCKRNKTLNVRQYTKIINKVNLFKRNEFIREATNDFCNMAALINFLVRVADLDWATKFPLSVVALGMNNRICSEKDTLLSFYFIFFNASLSWDVDWFYNKKKHNRTQTQQEKAIWESKHQLGRWYFAIYILDD